MPSSWNTAQQHLVILRLLKLILEPHLHIYQPIVYFDAAPIHLHPDVLQILHDLDLWYVVLPARLTWLVQPCDTHMFVKFKRYIKDKFQAEFEGYADRRSITCMINLVTRAIRTVLQGHDWTHSFRENGLTGEPNRVSSFIRAQIQEREVGAFSDDTPTMAELALCWPRNRPFPGEMLMSALIDAEGYHGDSENE